MADLPSGALPAATHSIHRDYLEGASPAWLTGATPARRAQLKDAPAALPDWYQRATPAQRQTLRTAFTASFTAQTVLDKAMAPLQDIDAFAAPLLVNALREQFQVQLDVHNTFVQLRKPIEIGLFGTVIGSFEVLRLPLLQAALHNFEAWECEAGAFHDSSGFITQVADNIEAVSTPLTIAQFTGLCRSLDIGAQYQRYLNDYLYPQDAATEQALRYKFSNARKADLAAAAELALLKKDIEAVDYQMIVSVVNGENNPWVGNKQVWFNDLGLMKKRMTGCVAFVVCEKYRYADYVVLYIPHDPYHPLKRYTGSQMREVFKQRFTERDSPATDDGSPTAYQRFFSQFVAYGDLPAYFDALTEDVPAPTVIASLQAYAPLLNKLSNGINPFFAVTGIKELPPVPPVPKRANPDPFLNPISLSRKGHGVWADNVDLWSYLFDQHRDKTIADARSHAVPTADVDARVRSEKLATLLNIGLLALNAVSMFVPVLGEVMMVVMAGQLLYETFEGTLEWAEGDRRAAKAHLVDVAENLAFLAVLAVGGKVLSKVITAKPEPVIESLAPVTLPNGRSRLCKPDLRGYESPVAMPVDASVNAQGQYVLAGKTYIRQAGKVYETTFDESIKRWRIKHPTDASVYQPPLSHNGAGAWRHTLERPLAWDRLTLMQRLGPVAEGFSDEQLLTIADISNTSDAALRRLHLDNTPAPAALADTLRLFRADQDVAHVIEQVSTGKAVDGRYLYTLPLVTELPRWPVGRVLEVFDGPGLSGRSQRYGVERLYHGVKLKAPVQVSRAEVLSSQLPARILAALDETEIVSLLGGEPARVPQARPAELRKQLAEHARMRQPALFDSLYAGTQLPAPAVAKLQRLYPGLSEDAARSVLANADSDSLQRFHATGRVPLAMQEDARWQLHQGRVGRAYAGLHMQNMASADSKRLALQTLSKLPGWSDQVRLEIRDGSTDGPLLDAIGDPRATQRKYLVKKGPFYQAYNERGETLNSLAPHGDNFYASVMHALPDTARQALGLPHVSQSLELRRAIIDYAAVNRQASAHVVEAGRGPRPWFRPPQRLSPTRIGYPASGRGQGGAPSLVSRVLDVYPNMTEDQANGFVLRQMLDNRSDAQIFTLLNNRYQEWLTLDAQLTAWTSEVSPDPFVQRYPQMDARPGVAHALRRCWRNAPLAELPGASSLSLVGEVPLPPLNVEFAHIRTLTLRGRGLIEGHVDQLLGYFPQVQDLTLAGAETFATGVPPALEGLPELTRLRIESRAELNEPGLERLERLVQLEQLNLHTPVRAPRALDVSRLTKLRSLTLGGAGQNLFPHGALALPELALLDLRGSSIDTLPPELFEPGHERLWSGLSVNWSRFSRERFTFAYDFVRAHPEHLMDQDEMVRDYCLGQLREGLGRTATYMNTPVNDELSRLFFQRWTTPQAQFEAIESLAAGYAEMSSGLDAWLASGTQRLELSSRHDVARALRSSWYDGVLQQYGIPQLNSLTLQGLMVSELPPLPAASFEHVTLLHLQNARVPTAPLSRFIRGFQGLRTLDVSGSGLTELTVAAGEWPLLEHLNLGNNPLGSLDVSSLGQLQALNLRGTALTHWPTGAEHLPHLASLDMRNTRLTQLPAAALAQDRLVLDMHLTGAPLTIEAQAGLASARARVEQSLGLPAGTLDLFEQQASRDVFPPDDNASVIARQLLPMPAANPIEAALTQALNGWLYIRPFVPRRDLVVSASTRRIAARRILDSWRSGLSEVPEGAGRELSFHGLTLGDLPELPVTLNHIERLNLNGVQLSGQGSNGFLRAFPQLDTLVLSSNPLQTVPDAVAGMGRLQRLELSAIGINEPEPLYAALARLQGLRWLDLSYCDLNRFRLEQFDNLHTLNLSNNELSEWPEGTLEAPALRNLDLSSNHLESIPAQALEGDHDALMAGTDLSDNFNLPLNDLYRLQAYVERTQSARALGFSSGDVQQLINDLEHQRHSDSASDSGAAEPDLPDETVQPGPSTGAQRAPWFENLSAEERANRQQLWDSLEAEPNHGAFFNLLSLLPQTKEFDAARASLTGRVWRVMDAAASDTQLRETLFAMSSTHGTCTDGRILTFSGLEIKLLEFETLRDIDPTDLRGKGQALLKLSRNQFRLDQVEQLAARNIRPHSDAAEVRLQYLIGLKQRLQLQGVPDRMRFAVPIGGAERESAAIAIEALEKTDAFYQDLISRDYWVDYLKAQYPEDFVALEQRSAEQRDAIEDAHPDFDETYARALQTLEHELQADETQTRLALSRRANTALTSGQRPGT